MYINFALFIFCETEVRRRHLKKFLTLIVKVIVFFVGWAVLAGLIPIVPSDNPAVWRFWAEFIPLLVVVAFNLIFWLIEKRKIHIPVLGNPILSLGVGALVGVIWLGVAVGVMVLTGLMTFAGDNLVDFLWLWIISAFLNVIMQELLVRGYLYQLIKSNCGIIAATILTTALFTFMHGGAFEAGIVPVLNIVTMSLFMTAVLEYTGSLLSSIVIHSIWNIFGAIILGGVSLADDYPHLLNTTFSGNQLLSGGACKIEGSIIVLILNIVLLIMFTALAKHKKRTTKCKIGDGSF